MNGLTDGLWLGRRLQDDEFLNRRPLMLREFGLVVFVSYTFNIRSRLNSVKTKTKELPEINGGIDVKRLAGTG